MIKRLLRGTQIACVPDHLLAQMNQESTLHAALKGKIYGIQYGFVWTDNRDESVFCRYWIDSKPGELRTVANSELTSRHNIIEWYSVDPMTVVAAIARIHQLGESAADLLMGYSKER